MGKRSTFQRRARDFYPTPEAAVLPLVPHLPRETTSYWEPCAGDGALIRALARHWRWGTCTRATDIEPQAEFIERADALAVPDCAADLIVTNPPWPQQGGAPTTALIRHLAALRPAWFLLSADFAHNRYFGDLLPRCSCIVSVGRVSWMENGQAGKDNAAWYRFEPGHQGGTLFWARKTA